MNDPSAATDRSLVELGAGQALAALRSGTVSAEDYAAALLRRIEAQSDLNACILVEHDRALAAARAVDLARAAGTALPPLAGLPLLVKDNINQAGRPTSAGTPALRDFHPTDTAPVLQRLLDQGAYVLAKTNLHELALGTTSSNAAFGFVRNPYDRGRIAGGSSGGSAAAVAARLGPVALGTDTGASVRNPSAYCGGAALRPSVGNGGWDRRYPAGGVAPISTTRDTIGPMARCVADVALLDAAITGAPPPVAADLRGVRLALPRGHFWENLDTEVERICLDAVERLRDAGVVFIEADLAGVPEVSAQASMTIALYEIGVAFPRYLAASGGTITWEDVQLQASSPDVRGVLEAARTIPPEAYEAAMTVHRPRLQALYGDYFRRLGVDGTLFPTVPVPAPPIDPDFTGAFFINGQPQPGGPAALFMGTIRNLDADSVAGIPGVAIPAGLTRAGLPVGLELDGALGTDIRLLAIALGIEAVLGRLPPPPEA
jgi:mandelamide amidase